MQQHKKVIWHEGMFLQPQHFQQHDRYIEGMIDQRHNALGSHLWGFTDLSFDYEPTTGSVFIDSARGIFPDGTLMQIPARDQAPKPIKITKGTKRTLYLAISHKAYRTKEIAQRESSVPCRYHIENIEIEDAIAGNSNSAALQVGGLACQILTDEDDLNGYSVLPFLRILEIRSDGQIELDKHFMMPTLAMQKITALSVFTSEIHGMVAHRAQMLAARLTDTKHAGTAEVVDLMLLQLMNKYEPLLHHVSSSTCVHPEQLYMLLIQFLGEIMTYTHDQRRPSTMPTYQHNDLGRTFLPVMNELKRALSTVLEQNATTIELEAKSHGLWVGQINDKALIRQCSFVLSVFADLPHENVRKLFPSQVKIAPVEQIRMLVNKALPGITLAPLSVSPRQIPYHANFNYFSLDIKPKHWPILEKSAGIALHVGQDFPGLKLELWAIKG